MRTRRVVELELFLYHQRAQFIKSPGANVGGVRGKTNPWRGANAPRGSIALSARGRIVWAGALRPGWVAPEAGCAGRAQNLHARATRAAWSGLAMEREAKLSCRELD